MLWISGAAGITKNPLFFQKWMLAGPEQAQLLIEFEVHYSPEVNESILITKKGFHKTDIFQATSSWSDRTIEDIDNTFLDDTSELLSLDKRHVKDETVVDAICSLQALSW